MPLIVPAFPRPLHAVVFDMDGLLIDTERHVREATLGAAADVGRPMDDDFYASIIGTPWPETLAQLLDLADQALYQAKLLGRNRVEASSITMS